MTAVPRSARRDAFLIALGFLLLYHLLAQRALHGLDVHNLVPWLAGGRLDHPYHYLYLNVVAGIWSVLQPLGVGAYPNTVFCSALGTSVGVFFLHLAARDRWVTLLCATASGVVFFATVAEIHGLFFGFAGLAWWLYSRFEKQPTWPRALIVAVATALVASVHATGHFLVGAMGLWFLARRGWAWRLLGFAAMHMALVVLLVQLVRGESEGAGPLATQLTFLANTWSDWRFAVELPVVFWNEWLWALAPLSLAPLVALWFPALRREACALLLVLVAYLLPTTVMLVFYRTVERGAYFLPLVFPAALLVVRMKRPLVIGTVALGAAIAVTQIALHNSQAFSDRFATDMLAATAGTKPALLCAGHDEWDPMVRVAPDVPTHPLSVVLNEIEGKDVAHAEDYFRRIIQLLREHLGGRQLYISERALRLMRDEDHELLNALARDFIPKHYRLEEVKSGSFTGYRLVAK